MMENNDRSYLAADMNIGTLDGQELSVGNHMTVLQLVRGPTSARLRSALGRWNPVEQTGLCIYSCFRTYRLELFNRVLPNQPTGMVPGESGVR
jgi:hypothetical protein